MVAINFSGRKLMPTLARAGRDPLDAETLRRVEGRARLASALCADLLDTAERVVVTVARIVMPMRMRWSLCSKEHRVDLSRSKTSSLRQIQHPGTAPGSDVGRRIRGILQWLEPGNSGSRS